MVTEKIIAIAAGFAFGMLIAACAGVSFPYRDYGIVPSQNALLGPEPKDDLDLVKTCEPDDQVKGKCHVFLSSEYLKLKQDYLQLIKRLEACERALP